MGLDWRAMKPRINPTQIALKDLPNEGREFTFTRDSGELNEGLKDLIDSNDFHVQFRITPVGNAFDLRGSLKTAMDLQCSLCATDFKFKINLNLHELILIQKAFAKGDQQSRANHAHELSDGGPDYILLESEVFDVIEYVHEAIALAEPIRPIGRPDCDENCENLKDRVQRDWLTFGDDPKLSEKMGTNPFKVLEKMKLKS